MFMDLERERSRDGGGVSSTVFASIWSGGQTHHHPAELDRLLFRHLGGRLFIVWGGPREGKDLRALPRGNGFRILFHLYVNVANGDDGDQSRCMRQRHTFSPLESSEVKLELSAGLPSSVWDKGRGPESSSSFLSGFPVSTWLLALTWRKTGVSLPVLPHPKESLATASLLQTPHR